MRRVVAIAIAVGCLFSALTAEASTKILLNGPDIGVRMTQNQELLTDPPSLLARTETENGERFYLCKTLSDAICSAGNAIRATSFLPPCTAENAINCISSVYAVSPSGQRIEGEFQNYVAQGSMNEYPANPRFNLPQGIGQGGIWRLAGLKNGAGNENYYVGARFDSWAQSQGGEIYKNFSPGRMITGISPVSTKSGSFGLSFAVDSNNQSADGSPNGGVGSGNLSTDSSWKNCVVTETGKCYVAENFPDEYRFGLTLRMGAIIKGWFHGRIYKPIIETKMLGSDGVEEITIEALPVIVPTIEEKIQTSLIPDDLRTFLENTSVSNGFGYVMPEASEPTSYEHMKLWIPVIKDKASKSMTYWSVRTLDNITDPVISSCTKSDGALSGIVTTNALVYNAGPPDFDKENQNLNYKVLSTHFAADGTVAKGTYDLILSSTVARCIYKFSNAPIKADLTILSEDGSPQVATQVINERNGWLTLSAAGFSYSSPTIRVKLTQDIQAPAVEPTPTPTPSATSVAKAKKTITCVKGKTTKKVSGTNPKCPTGFKKKG